MVAGVLRWGDVNGWVIVVVVNGVDGMSILRIVLVVVVVVWLDVLLIVPIWLSWSERLSLQGESLLLVFYI